MEKRGIILSNQISIIVACLSLVLSSLYYYTYGWSFVTVAIPLAGTLCLIAIFLNSVGYNLISRLWVCLVIPIMTTMISIYSKSIYYDRLEELDYFTFRFIMLATCVFPFILFSLNEKKALIFSSALGLGIILLHDTLHQAFGVGYHQSDTLFLARSTYTFTNMVILVTYCFMTGAVFFLKWISEKNENKNTYLIADLNEANDQLTEKNAEIEAQSMEILAQSEVLHENQQKLIQAYAEIERHKNFLSKENKNLTAELIEKNSELTEINTELIKHNNELRQFSYTVSHNLRGPVARLMGLSNLIKLIKLQDEDLAILEHVTTSVNQLDVIIHDLGKIIDIRHDIFKIRQQINLESEVNEIKKILAREILSHHVKITCDVGNCPTLYSVKPMVHSILYNLVSNGIKYRSLEREPEIIITAQEGSEHFIIQIKDNGLGIDLVQHKDELFKLYKRFNYHTEGKGLGLYLVKLQCEALGGFINVTSELNKFTTFTVYLSKPQNVKKQILYEDPCATIFYDAQINSTGVIWRGPVSQQQYRQTFNRCLEFLKAYNTPNWVSDISEQGEVLKEDQEWMFSYVLQEATKNGLKRIAAIRPDAKVPALNGYLENLKDAFSKLQLEQAFFDNPDDAIAWVQEENEKTAIKNNSDEYAS